MVDAGRRPKGRFFYWLLAVITAFGLLVPASGAAVPENGMATTTVADTVYMADGTGATGNLIITWPAFVTASGTAVAGGSTTTTLGADGALSVDLVPNAGATPAGVYYTVVYQIGSSVAQRDIVDPEKFKAGISMVVDGVVQCLNASSWAKSAGKTSAVIQ